MLEVLAVGNKLLGFGFICPGMLNQHVHANVWNDKTRGGGLVLIKLSAATAWSLTKVRALPLVLVIVLLHGLGERYHGACHLQALHCCSQSCNDGISRLAILPFGIL